MEHKQASKELELFIDESIRVSNRKGYFPTTFIEMRSRHETIEAMTRLVRSGEIQSGFRKMKDKGILEWSIESGVVKFRNEFLSEDVECAEWRLKMARENTDL